MMESEHQSPNAESYRGVGVPNKNGNSRGGATARYAVMKMAILGFGFMPIPRGHCSDTKRIIVFMEPTRWNLAVEELPHHPIR